jgi:RTX calcium-binding nonapeptide repeat (4 copies)
MTLYRLALIAALALGLLPETSALGEANTIPGTNTSKYTTPITANTLKPSSCSGITLTTLVIGNTGTAGADLELGSAAADTMSAGGGNDCILGGGGNDTINCGTGTDVAIGGPGIDVFNVNCETQIQ